MNKKAKVFVIHEHMGCNMVIIIETKAQFSYCVNTMNNSVHRAIMQLVKHLHIEYGNIHHIVSTVPSHYHLWHPALAVNRKSVHCVMLFRGFLSFSSLKHTKFPS